MNAQDLATLLDEANHPWESVQSALAGVGDGAPPHVFWLIQHLLETKREYWTLVSEGAGFPASPRDADLARLMVWEVGAAHALPPAALTQHLTHAGATFTVAELLRLNARHTAWHAGQIAALVARSRVS